MKSMKLTKNQAKQIRALKRIKDEDIDFTDIPEKTDWSGAVVGKFYRPIVAYGEGHAPIAIIARDRHDRKAL
jgi:hypothetical protein